MAKRGRKKRAKPVPYTNMTKELFREHGYLVDDVERKNCWSGYKNDLFGFGDLFGVKRGKKPIIIQSTGKSDHMARVKKILGLPVRGKVERHVKENAKYCLQSGVRIVVVSWRKVKRKWTPRLQEITLYDFN